MSILILFSILLCSAVINFTYAAPDTFKLFTVPTFHVDLTLNSPFNSGTNSASELIQLSTGIKAATSEHVFSYIESYLFDLNVNNGIRSVDLDVVVHNEWSAATLRSDIAGHVIFSSLALSSAGVSMTQTKVNDLIVAAFGDSDFVSGEAYPLQAFLVTVQDIVPSVVAVDIDFNDSSESSSNQPPNVIYDNETLNAKNGNAGYMTVSVAAAVVVVIAGMFVYRNRKRETVPKDRYLLTHVDAYDEEHGTLFDPYESSYETAEGVHFIPVPAKKEAISKEHRKHGLVPKVYVQAASPTEFVYGAAFSHKDQAKVARAHGNRNFRPSKVGGKKLKKKSNLKPLSAISETLEEEGKALVVEMDDFDESPNMHDIDESPDDGHNLSNVTTESSPTQSTEKDDFFVYHDFPQDDDTPSISFSPVCDVDWSQNISVIEKVSTISPRKLRYDQDNEKELLPTSSMHLTPLSTPEKEIQIDNFVDRLETLMAARARLYQESKHREKDLKKNYSTEENLNVLSNLRVKEEDTFSIETFEDHLTYLEDTVSKELFPSEIDEEGIRDDFSSSLDKESSINSTEIITAVSNDDILTFSLVNEDISPEVSLLVINEPCDGKEIVSTCAANLGLDPEKDISMSNNQKIHENQLGFEREVHGILESNVKTSITPTAQDESPKLEDGVIEKELYVTESFKLLDLPSTSPTAAEEYHAIDHDVMDEQLLLIDVPQLDDLMLSTPTKQEDSSTLEDRQSDKKLILPDVTEHEDLMSTKQTTSEEGRMLDQGISDTQPLLSVDPKLEDLILTTTKSSKESSTFEDELNENQPYANDVPKLACMVLLTSTVTEECHMLEHGVIVKQSLISEATEFDDLTSTTSTAAEESPTLDHGNNEKELYVTDLSLEELF